jgi:3-hydroxybutyryl-CoA dehydrogenase
VELVRGPATSDATLADGREWVERLGKTAVLVADTPGFIVNRLLIPYLNEAALALQEGIASAEDIDTAMRLGAGHPMGPLALADLIGLDVVVEILETRARVSGNPHLGPCRLLKEKVARGELGRKTGHGFYKS